MTPLRVSQIFTVWSSDEVTIHLPSQWKPTPVMLPVCPVKVSTGEGFVDLMSYSLTECRPAAARKRLSGEMQSRLTCESGCWIVREQIPERASQNLGHEEIVSSRYYGRRHGGREGVQEGPRREGGIPNGVIVTRCITIC